jgi:C4-dicarboxylate-specific signal transduction histidine kinase
MARPIRQQILLIAALIGLVVFGALSYASRLTYDEQVLQLAGEAEAMAAIFVEYLERNLAAVDAIALTAARHPAIQARDATAAGEVLKPLVGGPAELLRNAVLSDPGGRTITWAHPPAAGVEGRLPEAWLAKVVEAGIPLISPLLGEPGDAAHALLMAYPVRDPDDAIVGVLGLLVHLEALEGELARIPLPPGSVITITDEKSVVVARSLDSGRYVGRAVEVDAEVVQPIHEVPRSVVRTGVDGVERVFGNAVVQRGPWLASVGIPTTVAAARTAPIHRRNNAIALGATLVILALSLVVVRRWLAALGDVGRTAERVAKGDLSPLDPRPMRSAELDQLRESLSSMINNLRGAHEAIAAQVTEERRMREEMLSLQRQLIRQERLAAIGVLVSGVAHELNNPLQAILGFAELLQLQEGLPAEARADLALIQRESTRASAIIKNLSRFGRHTSDPAPVRLRDVVASVLELRQRRLQDLDIALELDDQSEAPVSAVFTELQQVVLNFVINAEQAVAGLDDPSRRIRIRTSDARNCARLEVEDWGNGVPSADEGKLFQPFFTTKPVGEGTGLGLSVSYGIINAHGGEIGYRRSPNGGAIFFFELPTDQPGVPKSGVRQRALQAQR